MKYWKEKLKSFWYVNIMKVDKEWSDTVLKLIEDEAIITEIVSKNIDK